MSKTTVSSATSLPTRVLVLGMAHHDGSLYASELYPVAEACRLSPDRVRSCLRRLVLEGLFEREGAGRAARFRATPAGMDQLTRHHARTQRAFSLDAGRPWDGVWHLLAFAIPEAQRAERGVLRERVVALGGAAIQGGLYVSPHPWRQPLMQWAKELGVEGHLSFASSQDLQLGGVSEPRLLAEQLWPLAELQRRYEHFLAQYARIPATLEKLAADGSVLSDSAFLPGSLAIAVDYLGCFERDPLLPAELLPHPWPGRVAREVLMRSRRLALALRESQGRPPLFHMFDEAMEAQA